jgi:glutathione S-transferase
MKLYGALASPYVARVAMFAHLKGIELSMESPPGGMGSDEYKAINLTGKIPSLEVDGRCIAESEVICEYLEDSHPEPPLRPADPIGRAQSRMISRMTDLYVAPHNTPLTRMRSAENRDQVVIDRCADEFAKAFSYVEQFMGPGPFAVGETPTIADCALTPFIVLLKRTIFPFFDEVQDPTDAGGRLTVWWQAIREHPGCRDAADEYDAALEEFLKWLWARLAERNQAS